MDCPSIGRVYWHLKDNSTFRDLILAIRADEANHRIGFLKLIDLIE